jgi:hypothetical protein
MYFENLYYDHLHDNDTSSKIIFFLVIEYFLKQKTKYLLDQYFD